MYYLGRQKVRLNLVCSQLEQIANIHQTQHTIQLLLGTSDFVGALELISRTQSVLSTDLQGVTCLRLAISIHSTSISLFSLCLSHSPDI